MHVIRLRGPWQKQIGNGPVIRAAVPEPTSAVDSDGDAAVQASCVYRRRFHRPTGLDESSRVWLRIEHWQGHLRAIRVNGHPLPVADPPAELPIQQWLQPQNEVEIVLDSAGRLSGEVTLAID